MKLLKSMRKLLCGHSCTKDACAVRNDALSPVIGESPTIRPRASVRQRYRRRVVPLSQDIVNRSPIPPISGADEEEKNDKDEVPTLNKTKDWGKHLYPAVLLMLDGVERAGAVNDRSSKSGDIMIKVYSPAPVMDSGVSDTIADLMWRPHLPLIPEEEEIDSADDSDSDKEEQAENVKKEVLDDAVLDNVTGESDYQEAMKEVLALMAESSESGDAMCNVHNPAVVTARVGLISIANVKWRPHLPLIPEEEEVDDFSGDGSAKEEEAEKVSKEVLEGTVSGNVTGASDFQEAMDEVLALMAENSDSSAMGKLYNPAPVTARGIPPTIANVIWRPHLPVIHEEEEFDSVDDSDSDKEEEAGNGNKEVIEGTLASDIAGASDYQEAMNEVLALMAESSDSTGAVGKVYNPAPVTTRGIPATIANVIWRPQLPVIPEEEEFDSVDDDDGGKEEAENLNKDVLEGTMAGDVAGASDFQEAMNEVLALMAESSESVVAMHNVHNPFPVTSRGVPATIANFIWRPHLPPIPEEETV